MLNEHWFTDNMMRLSSAYLTQKSMDRSERFYRINNLLIQRKVVTVAVFLADLGVSHATFKRDLEYLRDRFNAPIIFDRAAGGYRYEQSESTFALPGLWFNASEIHALLTMQQLLGNLGPGLLTPHVEPLMARLRALLGGEGVPANAFEKRIRIQRPNARPYEPEHFKPIASALLQRKRLKIEHHSKFDGNSTTREVSPQRLNYYRENWYLDAFCHLRDEIRSFGLDSITSVRMIKQNAKEISDKALADVLDAGYGIFSGKKVKWAELAFTPERARWVSKEIWHADQQGRLTEDGSYHLRVPYSDMREICADVIRHVPEVRVVAPKVLRDRVKQMLLEGGERV